MSDPSDQSHMSSREGLPTEALGDRVRHFADDIKTSATSHAEDGKAAGAERLAGVAETADRVADEVAAQSPAMANWVRKAASELDGVSRNLKEKNIGDLLTMGKDFARREPAAFIAASALAGFALSRLLKSSSSSRTDLPSASSAPQGGSGATSGMAYHPGDAVRPTANTSSEPTRLDPSQGAQPVDVSSGAESVTPFPLDKNNSTATKEGGVAK